MKKSRSNKRPTIRYPELGFYPFRRHPNAGSDEEGTMEICAIIKDENENVIFHLDELVEICFSKWEKIIDDYKVV